MTKWRVGSKETLRSGLWSSPGPRKGHGCVPAGLSSLLQPRLQLTLRLSMFTVKMRKLRPLGSA